MKIMVIMNEDEIMKIKWIIIIIMK
jgi:hypothetical protein